MNNPIKYAVLDLYESSGYSNCNIPIKVASIASKCYVCESRVNYSSDDIKITHEVIFPYKNNIDKGLSGKHNIHNIIVDNFSYGYASKDIVDKLYDTYEEAKDAATEENENIKAHLGASYSYDKDFSVIRDKLVNAYEEKLLTCQLLEDEISKYTSSMIVEHDNKRLIL